ncbi:pheromone shutdown protein [Arenimonas maotaiensis]|uniref:Pheromone shutdown protein n=1 Tax=Arenimonas maotaiensis TaxID=1446479 RepID=A0A917CRJ2_9GAMM|nr:TraB/GumN family protein [Arenimonas maotaiensis]GGF97140.1 pheromone shutdown protein [Arenimonas maotaiensis]
MSLPDFAGQPVKQVTVGAVEYTLLGTAHVSPKSLEAVKAAIDSGLYDTVAVELDANRHRQLTEPDALYRLDIFQIIRDDKIGLVAANLSLAAYQRRLADQLGIEPGAELKAASTEAVERGLRLELIDRDAGITLKRTWAKLGFFRRAQLAAGLGVSLISSDDIGEAEIEQLKQGDLLESSFGEFAKQTPQLFESIIAERDRYMAAKLLTLQGASSVRRVLAVVGAGHLAGLAQALQDADNRNPEILTALDAVPAGSNIPWFTLLLVAFLGLGFAWGFQQGGLALAGTLLLQWILITGTGGLIGCLAARGHWLSCLAAFVASPLTPLHPALSSGMVSAYVEAKMHKPTYEDLLRLKDDTTEIAGWWKNRFARILVNFILTNTGTALAVWAAGAALLLKVG